MEPCTKVLCFVFAFSMLLMETNRAVQAISSKDFEDRLQRREATRGHLMPPGPWIYGTGHLKKRLFKGAFDMSNKVEDTPGKAQGIQMMDKFLVFLRLQESGALDKCLATLGVPDRR